LSNLNIPASLNVIPSFPKETTISLNQVRITFVFCNYFVKNRTLPKYTKDIFYYMLINANTFLYIQFGLEKNY